MKTKGSFARTVGIWIITVLLVTAFAAGTTALICRTQIGEAIAYHQLDEKNDQEDKIIYQDEFHKNEVEKRDEFLKRLTPLNGNQKTAVIIVGAFWIAVVLLYWFSVTALLAERAELIKFNRHIWFWLAFFTNIVAVILFMIIKKIFVRKCMRCGNYQTGGIYCSQCGAELEPRCSHCGSVLKHGTVYCPQCGTKV